ncbi:MAG: hypothetical protein AB8F78_04955 [Saprospiraceae bacterium]
MKIRLLNTAYENEILSNEGIPLDCSTLTELSFLSLTSDLEYNYFTILEKHDWISLSASYLKLYIHQMFRNNLFSIDTKSSTTTIFSKYPVRESTEFYVNLVDSINSIASNFPSNKSAVQNESNKKSFTMPAFANDLIAYFIGYDIVQRPEKTLIINLLENRRSKCDWIDIITKESPINYETNFKVVIPEKIKNTLYSEHLRLLTDLSETVNKNKKYSKFIQIIERKIRSELVARYPHPD